MNKKNYVKPGIRIRQLHPTTILAGSATSSPTGSGSSFGGNSEESNLNTLPFIGSGSNFGDNSEESGN